MTYDEKNTGVNNTPAAGEQNQEEIDIEKILFGDLEDNDSGVDNEKDAASQSQEPKQDEGAQKQEDDLPPDASEAFAKKLTKEREKIRDEERKKIEEEISRRSETTPQEQQQGAPQHRQLPQEEVQRLADQYEVSVPYMQFMINMQQQNQQLQQEMRNRDRRDRERGEYSQAKEFASEMKRQNSSLPDWDDQKLDRYRKEHYKRYGTILPWREAYRMGIADAVTSGELTRQTQQDTIKNIQDREDESTTIKSPAPKRMTVMDLPKDQFNKMVEDAKMGKYKRS